MRTLAKALPCLIFCVALSICCLHAVSQTAPNSQTHPFPMLPGTYWTYQGQVRRSSDDDQAKNAKIVWRTEVRRFLQHGDIRAAVISGFPSDVNWSDGKPQPSDSLLIESAGTFYLIGHENSAAALRRLEQPSDTLAGLLSDDDLILAWPLTRGKKFCDPDGLARDDDMYCWIVESTGPSALKDLPGVLPGQTQYELAYRTNPDDIHFTFIPNVGITAYEYHHHGTVADTELALTEFHRASEAGD